LANVLLESGQEELAEQYFRRSVELARQAGDRIHEGMFHMSLGYFYHRKERFAEAMPCYDTGMEILKAVGQKSEMARVRFNRANLLLTLGDVSRAEADLTAAQQTFRQRSLHYLLSYSQLLEGDLARKKQDPGRALEIFAESYEGLSRLKRPVDACWAKLHQVECLLELGDAARAGTLLAEAEAFPPGADQPPAETQPMTDPKLRGHGSFLKARWHWSRGDSAEEVLTQFRVAEQSLQEAGDEEARILLHFAWGMFLAGRGSDEEMRRHLNEAQSGLMACAARLPEAWQRLYLKNSPYQEIQRRLKSMERMKLPLVEENRGAAETENFFERELKALQKEIVGELDLSALVERVLDRMIQLTEAERGFILLSETPTPRIVVSRNIEAEGGKKSKDQISWSIAQDVLAKGEALMTVDAMVDDRFSVTASIHQLKLRSILCLPFKKDGTVLGAIYLDSRRRSEAFRPSLVKALEPFAELIGQLLSNARRFFEVQASLKKARRELEAARAELKTKYDYRNIVGRHAKMLDVFKILDRVTDVEVPVLILGESGVGKELVAKAIHFNGPRGQRSFVSLNCQAIPEGLFESELFGHMRGAFTGALEDREGLVEQAHRGTLFLDEIGDMPLNLQGKLLRVLQEGKFRRVGDKQERPADCRLLAATHQDLRQLIAQGKFREDLYFRLDVVEAHLPPLRERMEDLPLLVDHFLGEFAVRHGGAKKQLSPSALALLARYRWPGNVRELENTVTNACVFAEGNLIGPEAFRYKRELSTFTPFPEEVDASVPPFEKGGTGGIFPHADDVRSLREGLQEYEKDLIRRAMEQARGNITRAAISLKVARPQLSRLIKKYKIKAV
jgi:transcriptional regulator with GAF, ATPase, and Fis domain